MQVLYSNVGLTASGGSFGRSGYSYRKWYADNELRHYTNGRHTVWHCGPSRRASGVRA